MITLLQRVSAASVYVAGQCIANINTGILVLVGVEAIDTEEIARKFISRLLNYRVFSDSEGKMNLSLLDVQGSLLLVPQFTLAANTRKGRRPSFASAAPPAQAELIFQTMIDAARSSYPKVKSGQFGADMQVKLVNDGPVSFILD